MTGSAAGIYGNMGANYSSAKLGLLGLSNTLAVEGKKYNIQCNTVAPIAFTRISQTVMPEHLEEVLKPEYVSPLILYLCHDSCEETGGLFECGAGWMAKTQWQRSAGATVRKTGVEMTPEAVRDNWNKVTDFTEATYPKTAEEATRVIYDIMANLDQQKENPTHQPPKTSIVPEMAIGRKLPPQSFTYTDREVILYALGIGVSTSQTNHLKFLFELHEDFCTIPTYVVVMAQKAQQGLGSIPGLNIDPTKVLHGEQYTKLFKPLPTRGTMKSEATVVDVLDKGSGAVIIVNVDTYDEAGEKVAFNQFTTFVQQAGGFGGKRNSDKAMGAVNPPQRAPDAVVTEKTSIDQVNLQL